MSLLHRIPQRIRDKVAYDELLQKITLGDINAKQVQSINWSNIGYSAQEENELNKKGVFVSRNAEPMFLLDPGTNPMDIKPPWVESEEIIVFTSAARTASVNSSDFTNRFYNAMIMYLDVTAVSGTSPTLDTLIQGRGSDVSTYANFFDPGTSINATGFSVYIYAPTTLTAASSGISEVMQRPLPRRWRIQASIGGTTPSFTFSLAVELFRV